MSRLELYVIVLICQALVSGETGLAEDFIPSVNVQCVGSTMTIRVDTVQPFYGVIHGINRSEPGCSVLGQGGRKTRLTIDLSVPEGAPGSCGVKYNPVSGDEWEGDFLTILTCR